MSDKQLLWPLLFDGQIRIDSNGYGNGLLGVYRSEVLTRRIHTTSEFVTDAYGSYADY